MRPSTKFVRVSGQRLRVSIEDAGDRCCFSTGLARRSSSLHRFAARSARLRLSPSICRAPEAPRLPSCPGHSAELHAWSPHSSMSSATSGLTFSGSPGRRPRPEPRSGTPHVCDASSSRQPPRGGSQLPGSARCPPHPRDTPPLLFAEPPSEDCADPLRRRYRGEPPPARRARPRTLHPSPLRAGLRLAARGPRRMDERFCLHRIRSPTLILAADDDPIVPLANGRLIASRVPGARLRVVHEGGASVSHHACRAYCAGDGRTFSMRAWNQAERR